MNGWYNIISNYFMNTPYDFERVTVGCKTSVCCAKSLTTIEVLHCTNSKRFIGYGVIFISRLWHE